jgi:hypothetical protein
LHPLTQAVAGLQFDRDAAVWIPVCGLVIPVGVEFGIGVLDAAEQCSDGFPAREVVEHACHLSACDPGCSYDPVMEPDLLRALDRGFDLDAIRLRQRTRGSELQAIGSAGDVINDGYGHAAAGPVSFRELDI